MPAPRDSIRTITATSRNTATPVLYEAAADSVVWTHQVGNSGKVARGTERCPPKFCFDHILPASLMQKQVCGATLCSFFPHLLLHLLLPPPNPSVHCPHLPKKKVRPLRARLGIELIACQRGMIGMELIVHVPRFGSDWEMRCGVASTKPTMTRPVSLDVMGALTFLLKLFTFIFSPITGWLL